MIKYPVFIVLHISLVDVNANPDCGAKSGNIAPLLLVLGYTNGVQVWSIPVSFEDSRYKIPAQDFC